jgi:hypothetical protein
VRRRALVAALQAVLRSSFEFKEEAADALVGIIGLEDRRADGRSEPGDPERILYAKTLLVRMRLPPEVLKALST